MQYKNMKLSSTGINHNIIEPQFGSASSNKLKNVPLESLPLSWSGSPDTTKSYAITIIDYDAIKLMGMPWVNWIVANIPSTTTELPSNASITMKQNMTQGINSYADDFPFKLPALNDYRVPRENAMQYGGMISLEFAHRYTIKIYALDSILNLKTGFGLNDLYNAMEGHIIAEGVLFGTYNAEVGKL